MPIAALLRPQGRRGEVLADPLTDLHDVFADGRPLWLGTPAAEPADGSAPLTLESHFFPTGRNAGRIVLKLSAANTISEAETLGGKTLYLPAAELPELAPDTFLVRDLLGCRLYNGEQLIGEVVDVEFAMAPDGRTRLEDAAPLLAVQARPATDDDDGTVLIPFIRAWLVEADTAAKRLRMDLPEGLLAAEASE